MDASAHSHYSSYREMLLEHLFSGAVMRHLWLKGYTRLELLKPQVDDSGYDLVLEANGVTRHVQLKASHHGAKTRTVSIQLALGEKPSGCVVWIRFDPESLEIGPFLWFGGEPGASLPSIKHFKITKNAKGDSTGFKAYKPKHRVVPKAAFEELASIEDVVARLFGVFGPAADDVAASEAPHEAAAAEDGHAGSFHIQCPARCGWAAL